MKKAGQFFFTFIPFLLVLGIQFLAMFFLMGLSALFGSGWYVFSGSENAAFDLFNHFTNFWASADFNTGVMLVYSLLVTAIFGLWYYARYGGNYLPAPKKTFHPLNLVGIVMLVPGLQFLCIYIVNIVTMFFPSWLETYTELVESAGMDDSISIGMLLYSVLLAPVCEELIFRGVTLRQARKVFPFWAANLFQALLFGAYHMNMMQAVYTFCIGLFLGILCEKGGSIYHAVIFHALFNLWGSVISRYLYIGESSTEIIFWFIFSLAMTLGGMIAFDMGVQKIRNRIQADNSAPSDTFAGNR